MRETIRERQALAQQRPLAELPEAFVGRGDVRGCDFRMLKSKNSGYVYEVSDAGEDFRYEVFRRKVNARFNRLAYPNSEDFGSWAWCYRDLQDAIKKYDSMR